MDPVRSEERKEGRASDENDEADARWSVPNPIQPEDNQVGEEEAE